MAYKNINKLIIIFYQILSDSSKPFRQHRSLSVEFRVSMNDVKDTFLILFILSFCIALYLIVCILFFNCCKIFTSILGNYTVQK